MKKIVFSGFMASVLMASSAAFADDNTTLTTKNYVDSGLRAVYRVATGAENGAVKDLQTAVGTAGTGGNAGTGLTGDVEALQDTVGDSTNGLVKDVDDLQTAVGDSTGGLVKDVDDLQTAVGDSTGGLVKDVADLQSAVDDLEAASQEYVAGTGINITENAQGKNEVGLGISNPVSGASYVFKDGAWSALEIENTWDASILNAAP